MYNNKRNIYCINRCLMLKRDNMILFKVKCINTDVNVETNESDTAEDRTTEIAKQTALLSSVDKLHTQLVYLEDNIDLEYRTDCLAKMITDTCETMSQLQLNIQSMLDQVK